MEYEFRELKDEDVSQVMSFFRCLEEENAGVSFAECKDEEEIREWIKDPNIFIYAAVIEDKVAGVFRAKTEGGTKRHAAFLTCAVDRSCRGKSIAKLLTSYGLDRLKENGIKIARAYVYSDNRPSVNTILSCGFQFAGNVHMHHYDEKTGQYVDDLIFHKLL